MPADPHCPFCDQPVQSLIIEQGGPDFATAVVCYVHVNGEMHFVVKMPKEEMEDGSQRDNCVHDVVSACAR